MSKYITSISVSGGTINGANLPLVASGTISSAELLDMTTPITVIPAPGAGNIIVLESITMSYTYGTVTYTGGSAFRMLYNNNASWVAWKTSGGISSVTLIQAFSAVSIYCDNIIQVLEPANIVNQPVTVSCASAFVDGDGSLKYSIGYRIIAA